MAALHSSKKNQTIFLINNYDLILKVLHEFNIQSEETLQFSALVPPPTQAWRRAKLTLATPNQSARSRSLRLLSKSSRVTMPVWSNSSTRSSDRRLAVSMLASGKVYLNPLQPVVIMVALAQHWFARQRLVKNSLRTSTPPGRPSLSRCQERLWAFPTLSRGT